MARRIDQVQHRAPRKDEENDWERDPAGIAPRSIWTPTSSMQLPNRTVAPLDPVARSSDFR
jgi:hypothetical protein